MSKARRRSLNPIFVERRPQGGYAVRKGGSEKESAVLPTQARAIERARELSHNGRILVERRPQGDYAVRRPGSERASAVLPTQREAIERAREIAPNRAVMIERVRSTTVSRPDRVRNTAVGKPDEWRKP
jgi:uncharacterized protein YdaT